MKVKFNHKKKNYCIYETSFYINLMVTTKQKFRDETHNIKKIKKEEAGNKIRKPPN